MTQCPACQADNVGDATFCSGCRRYLGWQSTARSEKAAAVPAPRKGDADPLTDTGPSAPQEASVKARERAWVGTVGLSGAGSGGARSMGDESVGAESAGASSVSDESVGSRSVGDESGDAESVGVRPGEIADIPQQHRLSTPAPPDRTIPVVMRTGGRSDSLAASPERSRVAAVKPTDASDADEAPAAGTTAQQRPGRGAPTGSGSGSLVPPPPSRSGPHLVASRASGEGCDTCGRPVSVSATFCRCGAQNGVAPREAAEAEPLPQRLWWQRLLRRRGDEKDFRSGWRRAAGTGRTQYSAPLALRTRAFRALMTVLVAAVAVVFLGPWDNPIRDEASARVQPYVPVTWTPLALTAATDPLRRELPDFPAAFAVDGDAVRAWATGWKPAPVPDACGGVGGAASVLALDLGGVTRVDRLVVRAGLDRERTPQWSRQARPRTLDLAFSDGTCRRVELADTDAPQTFRVDIAEASRVRVSLADTYRAKEGPGDVVAVAEVGLERRD